MAIAKATLSNFRQAPRKMRLVANAVRGKKVTEVLVNLDFVAKKASAPIKTLILSALANAKAQDIATDNLIVKVIKVDSGATLYRRQPAAQGNAHPIRKRTSAIYIELGEPAVSNKKVKVSKEKVEEKGEIKEKAVAKPKSRKPKAN